MISETGIPPALQADRALTGHQAISKDSHANAFRLVESGTGTGESLTAPRSLGQS